MSKPSFARYLTPWSHKREAMRLQVEQLRARDGDNCTRCRRPLRFDLPKGHDLAPTIEPRQAVANGGTGDLAGLCLCHGHCNRVVGDSTAEVLERLRKKAEAVSAAPARARKRRAA